MKYWNFTKNIMIATLITTIFAIWSKEELHEVTLIHCWFILISVWIICMGLLLTIDKGFRRIRYERAKKFLRKEKANEVRRIKTSK